MYHRFYPLNHRVSVNSFQLLNLLLHVAIVAGAGGALTGAIMVYYIKVGKNMAIILWVVSFVSLIPLHGFFFFCPNSNIAGVNTDYFNK